MAEWIRFAISALLMLAAMVLLIIAVIGVYRFKYALNRMHAAAIADSVGILLAGASAIVAFGFCWETFKIILIIVFVWLSSPVAAHLVSRIETSTSPDAEKYMTLTDSTGEKEEEK